MRHKFWVTAREVSVTRRQLGGVFLLSPGGAAHRIRGWSVERSFEILIRLRREAVRYDVFIHHGLTRNTPLHAPTMRPQLQHGRFRPSRIYNQSCKGRNAFALAPCATFGVISGMVSDRNDIRDCP